MDLARLVIKVTESTAALWVLVRSITVDAIQQLFAMIIQVLIHV